MTDVEGAYAGGEKVAASFWSGHPQNGYRPDRSYAAVERKTDDGWQPVMLDGDWEVKVRWSQRPEDNSRTAAHVCTIEWDVPDDTPAGTYRIVHQGVYKSGDEGAVKEFRTASRPFEIN